MIYKLDNGGIVKLQKAGSVPEYGNIEQIAKYNREHGTHFWKTSQVLEHDKQQAQQKIQDKKKSFWEILAGHPESSGEAILNKSIEIANNAELPETRSKIYNDAGKAQLTTTAGSLLALPMLGEFSTYGLLGGAARLAGGFGGSAVGSWGLGKAGDWTDKQFGTNWMGTTGRIIGGFAGWPTGSNFTYKSALDLASKVPSIAKIGTTKRFIGDVAGRTLNKELKNIVIPNYMPLNQEHNLFRANVYKGGDITDPYYASFTTDPNYAAQYGKVKPYLIESKSFGIAKEPLMGSSDPVTTDMFIDRNVGNKKLIIGRDAITNEFPYTSNGIEIVSLSPKNIHLVNQPQRTKISGTPFYRDVVPGSRPISEAERLGIPKSMRSNPKALEDPYYWGYKQWNQRYFNALYSGNYPEVQRIRDLHFKTKAPNTKIVDESGNPLHMYHGIADRRIKRFLQYRGVNWDVERAVKAGDKRNHWKISEPTTNVMANYHTPNYKVASGSYGHRRDDLVYDDYLNITKPITWGEDIHNLLNSEHPGYSKKILHTIPAHHHTITGELIPARQIVEYTGVPDWSRFNGPARKILMKQGYDGLFIPQYYDSYGAFVSPSQFKSAEPITWNGKGEIIPIVKRDNFHNLDRRYKQGGILKD